jgi:putative transposase
LIRDRDRLFTAASGEAPKAEGLPAVTTLPRTPRINAVRERVTGTLRRELLDRILIHGERHLALVPREYVIPCDSHRPHQPRQQRPPGTTAQRTQDPAKLTSPRTIRRKPVVTGTTSEYHHAT